MAGKSEDAKEGQLFLGFRRKMAAVVLNRSSLENEVKVVVRAVAGRRDLPSLFSQAGDESPI